MGAISARKLVLLASLYVSQGLPYGFFTQALPVLMRKEGMTLQMIGWSSLLAAPWALKVLWAPLVDAHGSRERWIVSLQISSTLLLLGLAGFRGTDTITALMIAVLLTNLVAATQDVATDGLAVDLLDERERGLGNGVQLAGYRLGMVLGGGALVPFIYEALGWAPAFLCMAAMLALLTIPVLVAKPTPRARAPGADAVRFRVLVDAARRPGMPLWLLSIGLYKAFDAMGGGMVRPLLVDRGLTLTDIAVQVGTIGSVSSVAGAILGGWMAGRFGRFRALLAGGVAEALMIAAWIAPAVSDVPASAVAGLVALEHLAGGVSTAALFTLMMDACGKRSGATDYTLQASVVVVASGAGAALSGTVAGEYGYATSSAAAACCFAVALVAILLPLSRGAMPPRRPA